MDVIDLFYNRLDEVKKTAGIGAFLVANGVNERKAQSIAGRVNQSRMRHCLPSVWSLIEIEWLFSEDEMIALLETKLKGKISDKESRLVWEYFRTELSEKGRQKTLMYRQMLKQYWLEQAVMTCRSI